MSTPNWIEYDPRALSVILHEGEDAVTLERLSQARSNVLKAHERGELGFLTCFDEGVEEILDWSAAVIAKGDFTHQLVLGIGGSSLGALAVLATEGESSLGGLETHFSENIDPRSFSRLLKRLPLERTLVVIISKSGTTIETMSKFWIVYDRLIERFGEERASRHVVAITDPSRGSLRALAEGRGFKAFGVPPQVGGRFSVLTAVGLVPLALAGYDVRALLRGARAMRAHITLSEPERDMTLRASAHQIELLERRITQVVMMPYSDDLLAMADWFRQLWAESLGKRLNRRGEEIFTGITPIKALGVVDQHSQVQLYMEGPLDKHVMFIEVADLGEDLIVPERGGFPEALAHLQGKGLSELLAAELDGTASALTEAGRPTSRWRLSRVAPEPIGAFIIAWEMITAVCGELLEIDAFDQPGVERGKKIAHGLLGHPEHASRQDVLSAREARDQGASRWQVKIS